MIPMTYGSCIVMNIADERLDLGGSSGGQAFDI